MADCKKNKVKQTQYPKNREIISIDKHINKSISHREDPNKFYDETPSWCFHLCDNNIWKFDESVSTLFWNEILPQLKNWEKLKWQTILVDDKKLNHSIQVSELNTIAKKRIADLHIEAESIYSLRLNGQHRLYGIINYGVFNIIWFDKDHGDNETCVCRSYKKHTH